MRSIRRILVAIKDVESKSLAAVDKAAQLARALGAAYLGGTRLATLAAAGLVTESRPGAVRELTAAMAWDPAPWCPIIFYVSGTSRRLRRSSARSSEDGPAQPLN